MVEAAAALNPDQRATAFAVAAEIMRSDGRLQEDERNILSNLGSVLELDPDFQAGLIAAMGVLHADLM
jgi:tellurite resistance protein